VQLAVTKSVLFASTYEFAKPGYIRAYPYPITGDFDDYACTNAQILRICMTADENFLMVADEQGCLCIMEMKSRQDRFQRNNPAAYPDLTTNLEWSDEVLVTRAELDDCNTTVTELLTKVEELKLNNEYQLKLKDMNYSEKIKETKDKYVQELELAKSKFEMLQDVRVDYEIESIEKIKYIEELHQNNVQNMETGFQAQIMEMVENYQKLVRDR
jgi:cilia- and flagella-associated protein 57